MSQFEGGNKVRCVDCANLSGTKCMTKGSKVSVKKRRSCGQYSFSGEYKNSTPLPATYQPYVDKKTKQLMKKLAKMGVMPMSAPRPAPTVKSDIYDQKEQAPVNPAAFQSTATAQIPVVKPLESVGEAAPAPQPLEVGESEEGTTVVWSPEDGDSEEK